jgi:hypothetical protein
MSKPRCSLMVAATLVGSTGLPALAQTPRWVTVSVLPNTGPSARELHAACFDEGADFISGRKLGTTAELLVRR